MKRMIPIKSSRDITKFDQDGKPLAMIVTVEYVAREVTDDQLNQALTEVEKIFPVAWRK